ncbi:MAG: hypothetical protein FGM27_05870 [Candidatus Omnitrophica bacterium]|nr:hypothetical protein [Candidatus Omnitrophota bacterium]
MKKILIANLASPENPGDRAILRGTLKLIREFIPASEITLATRAFSQRGAYEEEGCRVVASYPDVERINEEDSWRKILRAPLTLVRPFPLLRAVDEADMVFLAGGAYFYSYRKSFPGLTYLAHVTPVLRAARKKKKIIFLPQSYGPFVSRSAGALFRACLKPAARVYFREDISGDFLARNYPEMRTRFFFMPDHALYLEPEDLLRRTSPEQQKIIGVTIRPWRESGQDSRAYIDVLASALERFSEKHDAVIRIIVQVQDKKSSEGDEGISRSLENTLRQRLPAHKVQFFSKTPFFSLDEISRLYSECSVLVCMRLHSALLSYVLGCPALVAGYQHKAEGILSRLGLKDLYLGQFDEVSADNLYDRLDEVEGRSSFYKARVKDSLQSARDLIRAEFRECLQ